MRILKQSSETYAVVVTASAAGLYDMPYNGEEK